MSAHSVFDVSIYVLCGYVSLSERGFALPCYRREGGNAWYAATTNVSGDRTSVISAFEQLELSSIRMLESPLWKRVAIGDIWQDVFLWGDRIHVGGIHEIVADIDDIFLDIRVALPLTAFDIGLDSEEDECNLAMEAAFWLRCQFGDNAAIRLFCEVVLVKYASLSIRRLAFVEDWGFITDRSDVNVVLLGNDRFRVLLSKRVDRLLRANGALVEILKKLEKLGKAANLDFVLDFEEAPSTALAPTPTDDELPRRYADFVTLGEAMDYAAQGVRGLNFHDARGKLVRPYPFCEMREDALAMAYRLIAHGIKLGDRVALVAETSPEFAALFFGIVYAGACPVPLPLPISFGGRGAYIDQLSAQLRSCDPKILFYPPEMAEMGRDAVAAQSVEGMAWDMFAAEDAPAISLPQAKGDDVAYLQYSSGSTRFPHGVAVTHHALLSNLAAHAHGMHVGDGDRCVSWLPWYHDMGLVGCFLSVVANQVSTDYLKSEDFARRPLAWLDLISRNSGTTLSYSPTFGYEICSRRVSTQTHAADRFDLSRWRVAGNGSDMIRPDVMQSFIDVFAQSGFKASAFVPSYGLAEATLAVSIMPPGEGIVVELVEETQLLGAVSRSDRPKRYRAVVNCGKPVQDMILEVRAEDGDSLPDRQIGRVWCTGPSLMVGYFRDPEATEVCLVDGWLDTGDMGYLSDGYLYIVGRAKDVILVNGESHWPQDIEWAIEQLPGFKAGDIAAFGITMASGEETPAVLVQCRSSDPVERKRLHDEIRERVRAITGMHCIVELIPPRTLPKTSSGKLSRSKARNLYLSGEIQPYYLAA